MTKTEEDNFKSLGEVLGNVLEKIKPAGRVEKYVLPEKCRAGFTGNFRRSNGTAVAGICQSSKDIPAKNAVRPAVGYTRIFIAVG